MSFAKHLPGELLEEFLAQHRAEHARRPDTYLAQRDATGLDGGGDPYAAATLDFGIRYEQAVLDWIDNLPPSLGDENR